LGETIEFGVEAVEGSLEARGTVGSVRSSRAAPVKRYWPR
jgi:hypothetical protein